ncbi:clasp N terminal-domain-containing protein [Phlebopus sp. FC_14]|nr:clasp N terminal-domain-containing protein [Phlebopus sp. FC_14]
MTWIQCNSPTVLKTEIDVARKKVSLSETEDSWNAIAQGISHLTLLCNSGGCEASSDMVSGIRSLSRPLNNALKSERSKLSGTAVELMTALAHGLGTSFEPLVSLFMPTLLDLCGRTNKVFASRARACIIAIIEHTQLPSLLSYLSDAATHKSSFLRLTAAEGLITCLNCFNPPDLEKEPRARMVEDFIRIAARDASADVRKSCKKIFEAYKTLMPSRVESFTAPLTPVVKKYLDIRNVPIGVCTDASLGRQSLTRPPSQKSGLRKTAMSHSTVSPTQPPKAATGMQDRGRGPREFHRATSQTRPAASQSGSLKHRDGQSSTLTHRPTALARREKMQFPRAAVGMPRAVSGPRRPAAMQMKTKASQAEPTGTSGPRRVPLPSPERPVQPTSGLQNVNRSDVHIADVHTSHPRARRDQEQLSEAAVVEYRCLEPDPIAPSVASSNEITTSKDHARLRELQKMVDEHTAKAVGQSRTVRGPKSSSNPLDKRRPKFRTKPPVKGSGKCADVSPELVPLPANPAIQSAKVSLPISSEFSQQSGSGRGNIGYAESSNGLVPIGSQQLVAPPDSPSRTPITALLSSIHQGFMFTPSSPLSPPQTYLPFTTGIPLAEGADNRASISDLRGPWSNAQELQLPSRSLKQDFLDVLDRQALEAMNCNFR